MNLYKFIYILIFISTGISMLFADNTPSPNNTPNQDFIQQTHPKDTKANYFEQNKDLIIKFIGQPKFTRPSIKCFFRHTFNNPYYAEKYLPFDLSHILTLSSYAQQTAKPREYLFNVISIFKQKIFFSRFINGYEFEKFLRNYFPMISQFFDQKSEKEERLYKIKDRLYTLLYDDFDKLKADPEKVLDETANSIDSIINYKYQDELDIPIHHLQHVIFEFVQICLLKLIWSPEVDPTKLWSSIKNVSNMLDVASKKNILPSLQNQTYLNQLFWSQIASFSYLIECWGEILPGSFYNNILEEINAKPFKLWAMKENDPLVLSKFRHLNYVLNQGQMRLKLFQNSSNLIHISPNNSK